MKKANKTNSFAKRFFALAMALFLSFGLLPGITSKAADSADYKYVYAGLTWAEYWKSEGVYNATDTSSSTDADARGEYDKGGFDAVTRATTNHGLHRGSFQSMAVIQAENGEYAISYWKSAKRTVNDKEESVIYAVLSDGRLLILNRNKSISIYNNEADITANATPSSTDTFKDYVVTGIKYVPVKVKVSDYDTFCKKYDVVENGETLKGGYSEGNLSAYDNLKANVTESTNGLKTAAYNASTDSFTFSARQTGTDSGIADTAQLTASDIKTTVKPADGAYGEFLRVDFNGNGYGALGSKMQAVKWTYYGNDSTYSKPVQTYGTKFAADNWMHKALGIQLGLTNSVRCQFPQGYDGTGYWTVTIYALGYADYSVNIQATADNIVVDDNTKGDDTQLKALVEKAEKLSENDYTAESWASFKTELDEAKEILANEDGSIQSVIDEAYSHLNAAINALVKKEAPKPPKPTNTVKKGSSYTIGNFKYTVTNATANGKGTVTLTKVMEKSASVNIPSTVKINKVSYRVTAVNAKVFANNTKVKKIVIPANVTSIGSKAFYNCKKVTSVTIKSTKLTTKNVGSKAFTKLGASNYKKTKVKVPASKLKSYKSVLVKKGLSKKIKITK